MAPLPVGCALVSKSFEDLFAQAGFTVLRFTWADLTENPATVITMIRRTLRGMNLHVDGASGA